MPINTGASYRFAAYTSFVPTQNRIKNLGLSFCLSFIKGSTRNYLKPKRKTNKQMHDFVMVCLMPIDQLPRIALVSQTSGFRIIQQNSSAVDLWFANNTEAAKMTSWQGI